MTSVPDPAPLRLDAMPATVSLGRLLEGFLDHGRTVLGARVGVHPQPLTRDEVARHALARIVCARALVERVAGGQWDSVYEALDHGATLDDVAAAAGLDRDEVRTGLRSWAERERTADRLDDQEYDAVLALLGESAPDSDRRPHTTATRTVFTLAIVTGDPGPDAPGDELRRSPLHDVSLGPDVHAWMAWHGVGTDDRTRVLVVPAAEFHAGQIANLVAWRDVSVPTPPGFPPGRHRGGPATTGDDE